MAGLRVHFVMPAELVERIDGALVEGQSRGEFVRRAVERELARPKIEFTGRPSRIVAVEQALSEAKEPGRPEQADTGSVPSSEGVRSAAPAEQPQPPPDPVRQAFPDPEQSWPGLAAEVERNNKQLDSFRRAFPSSNGRMARSSLVAKRDVRPVPKAKP